MTSEKLLTYEIMLLLAKYGRKRVIAALAKHSRSTEQEIEAELDALCRRSPERKQRSQSKSNRSNNSVVAIDDLIEQHPDKCDQLRTLFTRFQDRSFLPELKDVREFLQRNAEECPVLRSRSHAASHLFDTLASMDASELTTICKESECNRSALGVITDAILRKSG